MEANGRFQNYKPRYLSANRTTAYAVAPIQADNSRKRWMRKQSKQELFLDHYLSTLNLWRKPTAKDGFCLFRAVSEQLFKTQAYYRDLYEACRVFFSLCGKQLDLDWNEQEVMQILSRMYSHDFVVYEIVGHPPYPATCNGYDKKIVLCRVDENHLESVYPASFVQSAAICQSILYEVLYRNVFKLDTELSEAVTLIRDQNKKKLGLINNTLDFPLSPVEDPLKSGRDWSSLSKERLLRPRTTPPVPYRIAKALDPCIYRNVELDIWEEEKRELMKEASLVYKDKFEPGDKCREVENKIELSNFGVKFGFISKGARYDKVILENGFFYGHVQEVDYEENTAVVFIQELGEKQTVPYQCLKAPPSRTRTHSGYYLNRAFKRRQDMPVASSTSSQHSYQGNRHIVNSNRYNSEYSPGVGYEPCSGTVKSQVNNYMALDNTTNTQTTHNSNKTDNIAQTSVLMRYTPPALPTSIQPPSVYPLTAPSQQIPCLCVPFLDSIAVNQVNMNCLPSQDTAGKDLPEMNTLRFFFNLGVENYRAVCNGGQYWSLMDFAPVGVPAIDQQNANMCGYQFTAPPPPIPKALPANENEVQNRDSVNQNSYQPAYHSFQGEVYKNPKEAVGTASLTPNSAKKGNKSDKTDNVSVDCNDSGCDSDSISGSAHDDSFKENSEKEKAPVSPTMDLKRNIDSFIAKSDEQITTDADSTTAEFQVPSTTKPRTKRKYYMYGNHKLIKPIKDIPPRFLALLAENSAARARCEGEPIIIPFLPPRYNRYNRNNAVTGFNPDAKCFVPGQTVTAVPNDPSIIACSAATDPSIIAYSSIPDPSLVDTSNTTNGTQKYIIPYPPPNTLYVPSSGSLPTTNPCTTGVGSHNKVTGDGSAYKSSMPSSSTGGSQPCAQQYGATMQSVYYAPAASYPALPQGCLPGAQAVPAISYMNFVPNASQTYSMPAHVAQIATVQAAQ